MTPEQGKLLSQVFINTIQNETETTKKVIRAIPEDKKSYKPDPKSMSANDLAATSDLDAARKLRLGHTRARFLESR